MAMMMTGRVLLVCALCVLWCGIDGVAVAEEPGGVVPGVDEYLFVEWRARLRRECAEEFSRRTGGRANVSAVEECVREGMESLRAVVDGRRRWRHQRFAAAAAAVAAEEGDATPENDDQARNNEELPPEKKDETPVASGQGLADATTVKERTPNNPAAAPVLTKNGNPEHQQERGKETKNEKRAEDAEENEVEEEAEDEEEETETRETTTPDAEGIKAPSVSAGPGAILTSGSSSSSGVDYSSRIGGETGPTVSTSANTVGKTSKENMALQAKESQHAQLGDGEAAETLNDGLQQNSSAPPPTGGQTDNDAATLSADGLRTLGVQIAVKGDLEASRTEEPSDGPSTNLPESGRAPPESSQAAAAPEPTPQHKVITSVKEDTERKSMNASENLPGASKRSNGDPASAATTMQSTSTGGQQGATTPSSNGIPKIQEEKLTGNNTTENVQPSDTAETGKLQSVNTSKVGDSDDSTAVSHTTSPLLLLLLVACAAAAAVVAA
ncbi:mucin-associated surface protein [Trypanosoma cruzi cruzi]|uniref:Mucin-associated surface protein (MASP) n=1 Tax=Trypanosoma cruzi TaxID=5693 RepID=A0A2V2VAE0_TRYCR|nr:mucin-associated surface protein [Trypanosoma cruzi cruzi]PWU93339.1 Mucin-associated surface protein (MASP) [Trypanosoma cruzi]